MDRAFDVLGVKPGRLDHRPEGWFVLGLCSAIAILVVLVGIPKLRERQIAGNETVAIGVLKTIATAESLFREGDKNCRYATLAQLSHVGLIDGVLGTGTKDGYVFGAWPSSSTSEFLWFAVATPIEPGVTGRRYFETNHAAVIFYRSTASYAINTTDCSVACNAQPIDK